jgi:hypothetical protein
MGDISERSSPDDHGPTDAIGNPFADASEDDLSAMLMNMSTNGSLAPSLMNDVGQEDSTVSTLPSVSGYITSRFAGPSATVVTEDEQAPHDEAAYHQPPLHTMARVPPSAVVTRGHGSQSDVSPIGDPPSNELEGQNPDVPVSLGSESMDVGIRQRLGNAKDLLQKRYDKVRMQIQDKSYVTWDDERNSGVALFTCFFVCPKTGECFPCGDLITDSGQHAQDLIWYASLKLAKKAAAGKAEDCFRLREGLGGHQFCNEQPYLEGTNVNLPAVPQLYCEEIQKLRDQICHH